MKSVEARRNFLLKGKKLPHCGNVLMGVITTRGRVPNSSICRA